MKALLQASAVVVAALVLGFGGALAALELRGVPDVPSPALGSGQPRRHAVAAPRSPRPSRAAQARDSAASSTSPPRSAIPSSASGLVTAPTSPVQAEAQGALAGSEPHLVAVSPPVARAGQLLTISGTNFYSPDGLVQAFVGGTGAPTRCPTETVCVVTVPQGLGPPRNLPLAIETEAGTSNTLSVSYAG
ncbi:MAG: IPT/TIG domain-containing protein [Acidimicrobiales bacterium]